jgi:O-methyltransferase
MNIYSIINFPFKIFGLKLTRLSKIKRLQELADFSYSIADMEKDKDFYEIYLKIKEYTIVSIERCYALYNAVRFVEKNNIPGDFVECGVWRGGSCMLMAYTLISCGQTNRRIWLYDTFAGMVKPGENDGIEEKLMWTEQQTENYKNDWCLAEIQEVENNLKKTNYPVSNFNLIKGRVEDTIPTQCPSSISILRLDTDWYDSTKHELTYLYPHISSKGLLIIDDYGAWEGCKKAVDEYFGQKASIFMNRIDYTGRLIVKT